MKADFKSIECPWKKHCQHYECMLWNLNLFRKQNDQKKKKEMLFGKWMNILMYLKK